MAEVIAILEDDQARIHAMRASLAELLPDFEPVFFEAAEEMIKWLGEHLGDVALISLDHDLPIRRESGKPIDCGTGREVTDFLATMAPTCPVIVHSSNNQCAPGMYLALKDAGWPCTRVYPGDATTWISTEWANRVRQHMDAGWIRNSQEER